MAKVNEMDVNHHEASLNPPTNQEVRDSEEETEDEIISMGCKILKFTSWPWKMVAR